MSKKLKFPAWSMMYTDFDFDESTAIMQKSYLESNERLLEDIRDVAMQIEVAKSRFEFESDMDLLEAAIYEIESLSARYRHLIKLAKSRNIKSSDISSVYILTAG